MKEFQEQRVNLVLEELKSKIKVFLRNDYGFLMHKPFQTLVEELMDQCLMESVTNYSQTSQKSLVEYVTEEFEEQLQVWLRNQIQNHHNYTLLDLMILNKKKYIGKGQTIQCIKGLAPIYTWLKNVDLVEDEDVLQYVMNDEVVQTIAKKIDWERLNLEWLETKLTEDEMAFVYTYLIVFNIDVTADNSLVASKQSQKLTEKVIQYKNMPDGYKKDFLFEEILNDNKIFLYSIVSRYYTSGAEQDDLMQQASLGLFTAMNRFDPKRNTSFSTYATWWIKQRIQQYLRENVRVIRIPVHAHEKLTRLRRAKEKLESTSSTLATLEELSKESGLSTEEIQDLQDLPIVSVSLNDLVGDDTEFGNFVPDATSLNFMEKIENESIIQAFSKLLDEMKIGGCQKDVIMRRLGLGPKGVETLEIIGADYGLTKEGIRQIQVKIMKKLRNPKYLSRIKEMLNGPENSPPKSGREAPILPINWKIPSHVCPKKESFNQSPPIQETLSEESTITEIITPQLEPIEKEGENKMEEEPEKNLPKKRRKIEEFYQNFLNAGFSKEEVDRVFESLTDNQKRIVYAKWGENLGEPIKATSEEQYKLQRSASNLIATMKKKMLFYRRYTRYPQKGDKEYYNGLPTKSGPVKTREASPEEIAAISQRVESKRKVSESARTSAFLNQVQESQNILPEDVSKKGVPATLDGKVVPNNIMSESSSETIEVQPDLSLKKLPFDNCTEEQLKKLRTLLKSDAFTKIYQSLPLTESFVLISTFFLGKTLSEIATYIGETPEKVNCIYNSAIDLMEERLLTITSVEEKRRQEAKEYSLNNGNGSCNH